MRKVDGLVLNYDEAQQLTGLTNTVAAARKITTMGPKFVVVKKGEHGCLFVHGNRVGAIPAFPSDSVIDPTGAGDSFAGGMMGYLASRVEKGEIADVLSDFAVFRSALAHGTVMASYVIESFSLDRIANVTRDEGNARFHQFREMVVF
ncbi:MAG: PfkB family carbohydrate kinase [Phycisphaerales bacterium]